ncbi:hypothetical protein [Janthinobacterium agaricidamnosum]|uniref:Putative membrane protein n=1 Tax=Janthinobacterium agaricidamnosum NBRC 102515 = DSM 9628 TaxID=1349767 RepID=W0V5P7_9BURK|nr:hypothetical protein [Janthinobacterium agaricidamnosum]CDG82920.1 putative membrane protein [Janthinobacterium agaricidamnosum NBRC 102515 = DSM 9628]
MWLKSLAALVLGLPLAVAVIGLAVLLSGDHVRYTLPWLLMFFPAWVGAMSMAFLFQSGARACLWMGGANLLAYAVLYGVKAGGLVTIGA